MNCTEINEQDLLERYLLRQLSETEQDGFEQHYFECSSCFDQLQIARAIQGNDALDETSKGAGFPPSFLSLSRRWISGVAVIGFVLAGVVLGSWQYHRRNNQPIAQVSSGQGGHVASPDFRSTVSAAPPLITELARIDPPPYTPIVLRGSEDEADRHLQNAMRQYMKRDYASAISGLRESVHMDPKAANANLYLGACYLLTDQTDLAILPLKSVISAHDPTYVEQAHFYLAKAYIRKNDLAAAKSELERTVQLRGDREQEAKRLETELTKLIPTAR